MKRILFVIIAAALILFLTILLGFHLQKKAAEAETYALSDSENAVMGQASDPEDETFHTSGAPDVFGVTLVLTDYKSSDELREGIDSLSDFDDVMIPVTDENDTLIFLSDGLNQLILQETPAGNTSDTRFRDAIAMLREKDVRLTARYVPFRLPDEPELAALVDGVLMEDLAEIGFDEVLIDLSAKCGDEPTVEETRILCRYLSECRSKAGDLQVGVLLPMALYRNASAAKQVQLFSSSVDFMALDLVCEPGSTVTDTYRTVSSALFSLYGSFTAYHIRVVIEPAETALVTAVYQACQDNKISSLCFGMTVLPEDLNYSQEPQDETPEPAETAELSGEPLEPDHMVVEENPYATTSENHFYEPETEDDGTSDDNSPMNWY